ncbi:uncharacterized protein LOC110920078 [Helianthus annuus]|uniref:uncharacterized protein LOC110920078 n=1 Tax=Helianthus annuus TaxID=4232 RepID=UPI000B8FD8C1|nr:uncharacterized protein LOC110920078 [Helianthus annuus]
MPLVSFSGEVVQPIGQITLPTTLSTGNLIRTVNKTYLVVGARSVHNVILGRPGMCAFGIISSPILGSLKFPTKAGVATLHSKSTMCVAEIRQREGSNMQPPSLLTEESAIHPHFSEQKIAIGANLPKRTKKRLWKLLSNSVDVFDWQTSDMVGVPHSLAEHKLKVSHSVKPIAQRKRNMAPARHKTIAENAHPDKIQAVVSMQPPKTLKEIQSLNGKLVALHRFISKAVDRTIPFMKMLKKRTGKGQIEWTKEADSAFQELKVCLGSLPTLTAPVTGETVTVYLSASHFAISAVLVQILRKPEVSGWLTKWAIELSAFNITYRTRGPVKGQAVADFLMKVPTGESTKEKSGLPKGWNLYTDGASSKEGFGAGLILIDPKGVEYTYALRFEFQTSNNEAEYEALLAGLQTAAKAGASSILAHVDSLLVANQVNGEYEAREENMIRYLNKVNSLMSTFDSCKVVHIPRSKNKKADALSKLASVTFCHLSKEVLVETLQAPAIDQAETVMSISIQEKSWMTSILDYLKDSTLPEDKAQARKMKVKALQYQIHDGKLYRKKFLGPLLRCLTPEETSYVIREIHWGICGIHSGPRMVIAKAMNAGYFWPGMHQSAVNELQACEDCQRHAPINHRAKNDLVPVTSAWPFQKWGIDIVGPFPVSTGGVRFLLVAIDYFTKWIKAKPLRTITGDQILRFVWENIVCRYGMPLCIVSDNGKQFPEKPFKTWCERMHIEQNFTSVAHPQANGQVERANRSIVEGIKKRLGKEGVSWADKLPHDLWAHRTMPKTSTKETPFSLTYGTEAVILAEVGIPTPHMLQSQDENKQQLQMNLDLVEERREVVAIREAKYKKELEKHYNSKVKEVRFKEGNYVMRRNDASLAEGTGKMSPKWEGPYQIKTAGKNGAYTLTKWMELPFLVLGMGCTSSDVSFKEP